MVARAMGNITEGMTDAATTLRKLLKAKSESVRLSACRALLELGVKLRESVELEERIAELERRPEGTKS
jgi:HEAT repeat protein